MSDARTPSRSPARRALSAAAGMLALAALAGCAGEARVSAMVAGVTPQTRIAGDSALFDAVDLQGVSGGEETNPLWKSEVGDPEYEEALRLSLAAHSMLAETGGRYGLRAELQEVDQPFLGFSMEVTATARYMLTELATGETMFERSFTTPYTASFSSALVGSDRLRIANEGAMRENIGAFLRDLVQDFGASGEGGPLISLNALTVRQVATR